MDAKWLRQGGQLGPGGEKFIGIGSLCFWLLAFGGVIVFLLATSIAAHSKNARLEEELAGLKSEIQTLEKQNAQLEKEKEALRNDSSYVEKILRDEFRMVGPGELVVVDDSPR
jgi:cell division protein FtsB